jgi:activator of 2-hydroxyglutaryl-CoA dehydratase
VTKNIGIKIAFGRLIGIRMIVPEEAQIVGALGAALIARRH